MLGGADCSSAVAVVRKTVTERSRRVRWAKMRVSRARGRGREISTTSLVAAIVWVQGMRIGEIGMCLRLSGARGYGESGLRAV